MILSAANLCKLNFVNSMNIYTLKKILHILLLLFRYIICKGLRSDAGPIEQYMFDLNERFEKLGSVLSENDLVQVVPLELLHGDDNFFEYILTSNER